MGAAELDQTKLIQKNFSKLFLYSFVQCFFTFIPVAVPYFQSFGLSVSDVFLLQGIFGGTLILLDIPAGYVADLVGRRRTLIIGSVVCALGWQVLWFGKSFWHFALFEIILGVGMSLQSGCDISLLYNSMEALGQNRGRAAALGRRMMSLTLGEGAGALLAVVLVRHSLELAAQFNTVTVLLLPFIAWSIYEPEGHRIESQGHLANIKLMGRALFGHSRLLTLVIVNQILFGFATYCAVWSLQPYWTGRGIPYFYFGYLWAANSLAIAGVSRVAHWLEEKWGSTTVVVILAFMPIVGYVGMAWAPGLWGLLFTVCFPLCRGLSQVIFADAINTRVPPQYRATANSLGTLGMRALFLVAGPLLGASIDKHGTDTALAQLGGLYVIVLFVSVLPLLNLRREFRLS